VAACAQEWTPQEARRDITHRESLATALAVQHLINHIPAECTLNLQADATSTVTTWNKGSKIPQMNQHIIPQLVALTQKDILVVASHIPGVKNTRADYLSRQPDAKNYRLKPPWFQEMCKKHRFWPELDLFANRRNRQTQDYCSWRVDRHSKGNAWDLDWSKTKNWLNPPWNLIGKALRKLKQDKASALCCLPVWKTAPWWHMLKGLLATKPTIVGGEALYQNPQGENMPAPRWSTLFAKLDASQGTN